MAANSYDWIYMTPAIVVLFVNILFLIKIMWVSGLDWFRSYPQSMIASFNQPPRACPICYACAAYYYGYVYKC